MLKIVQSIIHMVFSGRIRNSKSESRQNSLKQIMRIYGKKDYPQLNSEEEQEARQAVYLVDDYTMTSYERLVTLWQQVRYLDRIGIPGCLVECGTWKGGACGMMALAHKIQGIPKRAIHLFDSFQGLPEPLEEKDGKAAVQYSNQRATGLLQPIGQCVGTLEENRKLMETIVCYSEELTYYHVGWFQDTVSQSVSTIGPIALLRLDGDWYESTQVCLQHFYPLVSDGGFIVIDDYGKWSGCRQAVDEFMQEREKPYFLSYIDRAARYFQKVKI